MDDSKMFSSISVAAVLILDDDLGFAMWLGRALNEAGLEALPASRSEEAIALLADDRFSPVELMIVNREVEGTRELLDSLMALNSGLKVIGIGGPRSGVSATVERPKGKSEPSADRYLKTVRRVLAE
jgi:ActR/RegA family two-component response regulator